jgi:hypothetical protein
MLTCLIVDDRCLILIHNCWRYNDPPKTLADIIMQYIKAVRVLLRDYRWIISWHVGRSHRYHRGWVHFFRFIRGFRLALLLLLFIFLSDRLHYFSNQRLLILSPLTLIESNYDPLNPPLGRVRTPLDNEFFFFHLVLVLLLID